MDNVSLSEPGLACVRSPSYWTRLGSITLFLVLSSSLCGAARSQESIEATRVGFDNEVQVGFWTPVRVDLSSGAGDVTVEVEVPDADGGQAIFQQQPSEPGDQQRSVYIKLGRRRGQIVVRAFSAEGDVLDKQTLLLERDVQVHVSTRESVLCLAPKSAGFIDLKFVFRRLQHRSADEKPLAYYVDSAELLPNDWYGYESIDRVFVTTSDSGVLDDMTAQQSAALELWVRLGGRLTICVGRRAEQVAGLTSIKNLLPQGVPKTATQQRAVGIEKYVVQTTQPLPPYLISLWDEPRGAVLASEQSLTGESRAVIMRYPHGLGMVTAAMVDLDQRPFNNWESQSVILAGVLQLGGKDRINDERVKSTGQITHIGYEDLSGQLRSALEQFRGPQGGSVIIAFSFVAACIVFYILLVAPCDYFLLRRLIGRMEWTWVTFPLIVLIGCGAVYYASSQWRLPDLTVNQVDVVDFDFATGTLKGQSWSSVYSPKTSAFDVSVEPAFELRWREGDSDASEGQLISWMGLPGRGLGGLNASTPGAFFDSPYRVEWENKQRTQLRHLPIAIGSTRQLTATWWQSHVVAGEVNLTRKREYLQGEFTNPFPVEIEDGVLYYNDWAYDVTRRVLPNQTISVAELEEPRDLVWKLTRRRVVDSRKTTVYKTTPWNALDSNISRLVEILSFYEIAGGKSYARLSHRYIDQLDLSDQLGHGRAIFVGRAAAPGMAFQQEGQPLTDKGGRWAYYRAVFPVAEPVAKKGSAE